MKIYGFQKMTLLDYPGKVACTIFTGGCNFRCPFCHNALLVTGLAECDEYDENEILDYLKKRKGLLDGVCITGGEPLMMPGTEDFMRKIKEMGYSVKLDTNGSYPERLRAILSEGLCDYVAMDIKNCPERYGETVGVKDFDLAPVEESIRMLIGGKVDYEFRTTVVEKFHTEKDIEALAKWISGAKRYYLQSFVDSGNLIEPGLTGVSTEKMRQFRDIASRFVPSAETRGI